MEQETVQNNLILMLSNKYEYMKTGRQNFTKNRTIFGTTNVNDKKETQPRTNTVETAI